MQKPAAKPMSAPGVWSAH